MNWLNNLLRYLVVQTIHLESKVKTREIRWENAKKKNSPTLALSQKQFFKKKKTDILCFAKLDQKEKLLFIDKGV